MIIQARGSTALLITQPDHAALSGRLMAHWKDRDFDAHPRRASILLAVREHDNGWHEVDATPVVDPASGQVLDFMNVPADTRRAIWPRGVERLARNTNDRWAAALVAQHAVHVYRHYRHEREWTPFFAQMETARDEHAYAAAAGTRPGADTAQHARSMDELLADYFFVRVGDLLSLTFCNGWSRAPDELGYTIGYEDGRLTVEPDPFGGCEVPIEVRARLLPQTRFASGAEADRAFASATISTFRGIACGRDLDRKV